MNLLTKLIILFSLLAVIPIVISGYLSYINERDALLKKSIEQIISVADIQEKRIEGVINRHLEHAALVTSRTQLRVLFRTYPEAPTTETYDRIKNILLDAKLATRGIDTISIADRAGTIWISTDDEKEGMLLEDFEQVDISQPVGVLTRLFKNERGLVRIRVLQPMQLDGDTIGVASLTMSSNELISTTADYAGLGESGETYLGATNNSGDGLLLTPLRFDAGAALTRVIPKEKVSSPLMVALRGEEVVLFNRATTDYRDHTVIAATRFVESVGWGLVVKVDRDEVFHPITQIVYVVLTISILASLLICLITFLTLRSILQPIKLLQLFAQNLTAGNFSMRTEVHARDEIGVLATAMNGMADRLQEMYATLEKKVAERTKQLAESTAKFQGAFEASAVGFALVSTEGKWLEVNDAIPAMLGYSKEELKNMTFQDITHPDDLKKDLGLVGQMLDGKIKTYQMDKRYIHKDGYPIWALLSVSAVRTKAGKVKYFVSQIIDITKQKEVDQAKTEFVSLASHQLRTPLSTINWYVEMLLAGDAGEVNTDQKKYLEEIYTGNQRMVELVNSLLNVSRLELGTFAVEPEPTNVNELAESVVSELMPQINERKQKLNTSLGKNVPEMNVDPKLLRMILQNLLSNASKYTPEKGTLSLSTQKSDAYLELVVADSGIGIPKEQQSKLFTKLFRADNARESDTDGTGLGLYIVKSVIDNVGGTITYTSEENKGTTFTVRLPLSGMKKRVGGKSLD